VTGRGTRHGTLAGYHLDGCRCELCTAEATRYEKRRLLDAIEGRPRAVDATGSRRRIQALAVAGFPIRVIAEQLGTQIGPLHRAVNGKRLAAVKAREIARVYRRLRFADPARYGVDLRQSARVARMARAKGWSGPEAWETADMDDPGALPTEPDPYRPLASYEAIAEDALWVLATAGPDTPPAEVAARLGVGERRLFRALAYARSASESA
jgi:hypothetical protein